MKISIIPVFFLSVLVLSFQSLNAQVQFEPLFPSSSAVHGPNVFEGVEKGSVAFADVDGDNEQDVLITGLNVAGDAIAKLYTNDGTGVFTEVFATPFVGVKNSSIDFADIDGDNDVDVLITGQDDSDSGVARLYSNNGSGVFTEVQNTPFEGVYNSSIAFADIDNDNDFDVLITGINNNDQPITKLYINDGNGQFTHQTGTPFVNVHKSSVAFADVDGNNFVDVFIMGSQFWNGNFTARLYMNYGNGYFTEQLGSSFQSAYRGKAIFGDVNGDNAPDLFYGGASTSRFYLNDGNGNLIPSFSHGSIFMVDGSAAFVDFDGDSDLDLVSSSGYAGYAAIAVNDGNGLTPSQYDIENLDFFKFSSMACADVNGDGIQEVLITGRNKYNVPISKLYAHDGNGGLREENGSFFRGVWNSAVAYADVDNDNDIDLLIAGEYQKSNNGCYTKLFINDGNAGFTEDTVSAFEGIEYGSVAFADIDGDNDQDVVITGYGCSSQEFNKVYLNDGTGFFIEDTINAFDGVHNGSLSFSDIDDDGDQDLLVSGSSPTGYIAKIYRNDGNGVLLEDTAAGLNGVTYSASAFSDVDHDGDQDVLISGSNSSVFNFKPLYLNDGNGVFTATEVVGLMRTEKGSVCFADADGDGDEDFFITGYSISGAPISKLFINFGSGDFYESLSNSFEGVVWSSADFSDVDGDGDQDILLSGEKNMSGMEPTIALYVNDGSGNFTEELGIPFEAVGHGTTDFVDLNGDGLEDVIMTGRNAQGIFIFRIFLNTSSLGSEEMDSTTNNHLTLFPNPATDGVFSIEIPSSVGNTEIVIYDLQGKKVYSELRSQVPTLYEVNVGQLSPGLYLIHVIQGYKLYKGKIIVD